MHLFALIIVIILIVILACFHKLGLLAKILKSKKTIEPIIEEIATETITQASGGIINPTIAHAIVSVVSEDIINPTIEHAIDDVIKELDKEEKKVDKTKD